MFASSTHWDIELVNGTKRSLPKYKSIRYRRERVRRENDKPLFPLSALAASFPSANLFAADLNCEAESVSCCISY
jgi:hypothetical protein